MIDCTPLTLDDATLAHLLSLASRPPWTHAPLALRVTPDQMADLLDVEFVDGHAYLGDVPVVAWDPKKDDDGKGDPPAPPPRPRPPVKEEPYVEPVPTRVEAARADLKAIAVTRNVDDKSLAALTQRALLLLLADGAADGDDEKAKLVDDLVTALKARP